MKLPYDASCASKWVGNTVSDNTMRRLGRDIVTGKYQPGDRLLPEIDAADAYGISRTAYREACRILTTKGLLNSRQKSGTIINSRDRWNLLDPDVLAWALQSNPSRESINALFEMRLALEPMAASLAAQRRSERQIAELRDSLDTLTNDSFLSAPGRQAKRAFHMVIFQATQNEFLCSLAPNIGALAEWTVTQKTCLCPITTDPLSDHLRLILAIEEGSSEIARSAATTLLLMNREQTIHALFGHN